MKYVVFGAAGQLGRDLCPRLNGEVVGLTRAEVDLTSTQSLQEALHSRSPDVVVNCAAYNLVDKAEDEPDTAFAVNTWAVRAMAQTCRELDCALVHFSTDYVYGIDSERREPWGERDAPGPLSVYGLSKLSGEYVLRSICPKHFVIRTCGLYGVWGSGGKGGNFVETMIRLGKEGKPLKVVNDQICTPSYTVDIAQAVIDLLATQDYGLYHLTNQGSTTWHDLARTVFEMEEMDVDLTPITTEEFGAVAARPAYSALSMKKYQSLGLIPPRPWRDAIAAYLEERQQKASHKN